LKKRNVFAKDLLSKKYRKRIVKPKKGKGSFKRRKKKRVDQTTLIDTLRNFS